MAGADPFATQPRPGHHEQSDEKIMLPLPTHLPRPLRLPRLRLPNAGHFAQSVMALGLAQGLSWVGTAALVVVLPTYLGDVNLGRLAFATTLTGTIAAFSGLGISAYLSREIARRPQDADSLMGNALAMRIPLALLGIVLTVVLAQL